MCSATSGLGSPSQYCCILEWKSGLDYIRFFVVFMQCVCVICLEIIEDQINLNGYLNLKLN